MLSIIYVALQTKHIKLWNLHMFTYGLYQKYVFTSDSLTVVDVCVNVLFIIRNKHTLHIGETVQ